MKYGPESNLYMRVASGDDTEGVTKVAAPVGGSRAYPVVKRVFDLVCGVPLFLVSLPIILVLALAIRIETPGSPFFFQTRLGKGGKPFRIFKMRGMFIDARARYPELYDYSKNKDLNFHFHYEVDPRVTRVGSFIRRTSLDELPNFWNVVLGDMSLVGPRPEIPDVLALYGSHRGEYLSVKPGVTCASKCTGRDALTKHETIMMDLQYIRARSFGYDLSLIWKTIQSVLRRRDVY
jgi:lipopolysaccharide/colanic/teichoic acid biosynthesis glycosyltransferase